MLGAALILLSACQPTPVSLNPAAAPPGTAAAPLSEAAATATPAPAPLSYSGSGGAELELGPWQGPAVLKIHAAPGGGDFRAYTRAGLEEQEFARAEGPYEGYHGVEFGPSGKLALTLQGARDWRVEVLPISADYFDRLQVPGEYEGQGSRLILLEGDYGIANFVTDQAGAFEAWAHGPGGVAQKLTITKEGSYKGNSVLPEGAQWLVVNASGPWSMTIQEPCCERLW